MGVEKVCGPADLACSARGPRLDMFLDSRPPRFDSPSGERRSAPAPPGAVAPLAVVSTARSVDVIRYSLSAHSAWEVICRTELH